LSLGAARLPVRRLARRDASPARRHRAFDGRRGRARLVPDRARRSPLRGARRLDQRSAGEAAGRPGGSSRRRRPDESRRRRCAGRRPGAGGIADDARPRAGTRRPSRALLAGARGVCRALRQSALGDDLARGRRGPRARVDAQTRLPDAGRSGAARAAAEQARLHRSRPRRRARSAVGRLARRLPAHDGRPARVVPLARAPPQAAGAMSFDVVLAGGSVLDGGGGPAVAADLGIDGGAIRAVGDLAAAVTRERIDVRGLHVAPGFIDVHTHSDLAPLLDGAHDELRLAAVRQGVTTEICGNCGFSVFPAPAPRSDDLRRHVGSIFGPTADVYSDLGRYRAAVENAGLVTNLATLVGHGTIRAGVVGFDDRPADPSELSAMRAATASALDDGALGLSSGLVYAPGVFADGVELVELARAAADRGRPYVSHIRNEADDVEAAIDEALWIGRESGAAVQISHHKTAGRRNWGRTTETLERLAEARRAGIDVTVDVYPYTAGSTILASLLPPWANAGGMDELLERLGSADARDRIRRDLARGLERWQRLVEGDDGWQNVRIASA